MGQFIGTIELVDNTYYNTYFMVTVEDDTFLEVAANSNRGFFSPCMQNTACQLTWLHVSF